MKKTIAIFLLSIFITLSLTTTVSSTALETNATPSILSEPQAVLLFTEVNFKNKDQDYFVLKYKSPSGKPFNLKGITIVDDSVIKNIENDFIVASGQEILLTYKSTQTDSPPYLYSTKQGLTATTEQVIIYDNNQDILDMVCWTNEAPTETEINDHQEAYEKKGWASSDIKTCLSSEAVDTNGSIKRKNLQDTNSAADWEIEETNNSQEPSPSATTSNPVITQIEKPAQTTENLITAENSMPKEITTPPLVEITIPKEQVVTNPDTKTTAKKSTSKKEETQYQNGSPSGDIRINEVLPNPDGTDTKKEWIELHNIGDETINLGNWILDDIDGGSKPYIFPDSTSIKPDSYLLVKSETSKLSLGNTEDSVRLFNYDSELIDEISYEDSPSGKSFSLIAIYNEEEEAEEEYIWTQDLTPGSSNPVYYKITGTISREPVFEDLYSFIIENDEKQPQTIIFTEDIIPAPLAKATFQSGTTLSLIVEKSDNGQFLLKTYEVIGNETINNIDNNSLIPYIITCSIIIIGAAAYYAIKKIPWQNEKKAL